MSSTILMAIVLVVMWLVVLVPMFVRRHDDHVENRSVDRFATAMRVLSRRSPGTGGVAGRRRYPAAPPVRYADGASPVRTAARAEMLRRRRRTLAVLAAVALVGVPLAMATSPWLWLAQVPAVLLLVGYVAWLRQQVHREQARRSRRAALFGQPATAGRLERPATGSSTRRARPAPRTAASTRSHATDHPDRSWRPVPVPKPTYVGAPVARRRTEAAVALDDDDLSFADLDALGAVDRPRAVNE